MVGDIFMKYLFVAETVDIELERLQLYAPFIGYIVDVKGCKVRKSASGAKAGKLGAGEINVIAAHKGAIFKALQLGFFNRFFSIEFGHKYCLRG